MVWLQTGQTRQCEPNSLKFSPASLSANFQGANLSETLLMYAEMKEA